MPLSEVRCACAFDASGGKSIRAELPIKITAESQPEKRGDLLPLR